ADDPHAVLVGADVALVDGHAVIGVLVGELLGIVLVGRVPGRDAAATVTQPLADGQPDPADPSGYQCDLPVHVCHGVNSVRCRTGGQIATISRTRTPRGRARGPGRVFCPWS